jgi:sulfonate transport system ATP-binding protein
MIRQPLLRSLAQPGPLFQLRLLEKRFKGSPILGPITLSVNAGEVVALIGPSGCGKSTLLRIVAGLDHDYQGQLAQPTEAVAFVFQEPRLMPWLTVEQNIGFADDHRFDRDRVAALIEEVGLTGFAGALPKALSGGMAQRVAIARALYGKPGVLLLDEPFSAVDAFTRYKLQDLLLQVAARHDVALLLVTHDVDEALYLSDRVLVLGGRPGHVCQELRVALARPRPRASEGLAEIKGVALHALQAAGLQDKAQGPEGAGFAAPLR